MKKISGLFAVLAGLALICYSGDRLITQNQVIAEQQEIIRIQQELLVEINDCVLLAERAREMRDEQYRMLYQSFYF